MTEILGTVIKIKSGTKREPLDKDHYAYCKLPQQKEKGTPATGALDMWLQSFKYLWTTRRSVDLGVGRVSHLFIVMPDCPCTLLGRDLLTKMGHRFTSTLMDHRLEVQKGSLCRF